MKKLVGISLFVFWAFVAAILTAGLVFYQNNKNSPISNSILNSKTNDPAQEKQITLDETEIAKHGSIQNCWIIINGKVYDVTSYFGAHPGGASTIAPYCGKEASNAFATKDTGSSHSANANSMLSSYYIGDLNQKMGTSQTAQNAQNAASSQAEASLSDAAPVPLQPSPAKSGQTTLSSAEIAKHNSTGNCWIIISGKIYNVTNYLRTHPGGTGTITPYCGKDATQAFNTKGGSGSHSGYANELLASYYMGNLNEKIDAPQTAQNNQNANPSPTPVPASPTPSVNSNINLNTTEILKHNSTNDCWVILNGKVFNMTSYLPYHPGGVGTISPYCGKDAAPAFQAQGHSSYANNLLSSYYVGDLNQNVSTAQVEQNVQNTNNAPPPINRSDDDDEYEDD